MRRFEKQFFHLAGWMLCCRLQAMGEQVLDSHHPLDLGYDLLGMQDYMAEMRLLTQQEFSKRKMQLPIA